ncbi:hypothetical protein NUF17_003894 [Escherichia coli]|nr:hypothetical protein [Escherichia coli]MDY9576786.1 hypothetical protein [Escherichia coli]
MFIAIFITSIITCIIVLAIIYFPYKKVADLLSKFIHVRTMFTGIFLLLPVSLFGFICIIASFLINHLFGSEEERSNAQDAAEQAKVKGLTK